MVEESAVELVVAAAAVHTQQWHWSSDQHLSHIHLELVVPPQAGSPQEKTSEQLQHLSDQAAVTHTAKLKLALKRQSIIQQKTFSAKTKQIQPYFYMETQERIVSITTKLSICRAVLKVRLKSPIIALYIHRGTESEIPLLGLLSIQFCSKYDSQRVLYSSQPSECIKINFSFLKGTIGNKKTD